MTISDVMPAINQLSKDEQIELACLIWDRIVQENQSIELNAKQEQKILERMDQYNRGESRFENGWDVIRRVRDEP